MDCTIAWHNACLATYLCCNYVEKTQHFVFEDHRESVAQPLVLLFVATQKIVPIKNFLSPNNKPRF